MSNCFVKLTDTYHPTVVPPDQPIVIAARAVVENCSVTYPAVVYYYYMWPSSEIFVEGNSVPIGSFFGEISPFTTPPCWPVFSGSGYTNASFPSPGIYIVGFASGYWTSLSPSGRFIPQEVGSPIFVLVAPGAPQPGLPALPPPQCGVKIVDAYISSEAKVEYRSSGEL